MSDNKMSLFYKHTYGRRFPVPLLSLEVYSKNIQGAVTDTEVYNVLTDILSSVCKIKDPDKGDVEYFIKRLQLIDESLSKPSAQGREAGRPKRSFGTSFSAHLEGLSLDSALLKMTGYNMDAASRLYCETDRDDVMALVSDYFSGRGEENLVAMEATLYGSGNSYKEDKGTKNSNASTHDLQTKEGVSALKSMGF